MKYALLVMVIFTGIPIHAVAARGMFSIWYYEDNMGRYKVAMSKKAELDSYNGDTQGPIKSELHIYKETRGRFPEKATFITKAVCEHGDAQLRCDGDYRTSGIFGGARYEEFAFYKKVGRGYKKGSGNGSDKAIADSGKKLIRGFEMVGQSEAP